MEGGPGIGRLSRTAGGYVTYLGPKQAAGGRQTGAYCWISDSNLVRLDSPFRIDGCTVHGITMLYIQCNHNTFPCVLTGRGGSIIGRTHDTSLAAWSTKTQDILGIGEGGEERRGVDSKLVVVAHLPGSSSSSSSITRCL